MTEQLSLHYSFLLANNIPLYGSIIFCLSFHQLIGILGCFYFWVIVNNAAITFLKN